MKISRSESAVAGAIKASKTTEAMIGRTDNDGARLQNRERTGVPKRADRLGWWMRPVHLSFFILTPFPFGRGLGEGLAQDKTYHSAFYASHPHPSPSPK